MADEHLYRPRVNMKDYRATYYDYNYIPDPNGQFGPDHSNPYDQNSNNPFIRTCNYLFGRWHEGGTYGERRWSVNTNLGRIREDINYQFNRFFYGTYEYWYRASDRDFTDANTGNTYSYYNTDNINRLLIPTQVGQIVLFINITQTRQDLHAGVIERFNGYTDYYISHLNTSGGAANLDYVEIEHIENNEWITQDSIRVFGYAIDNFYSTLPSPQNTWPVHVGKPIGWKPLTILYNKHYNDIRKGNDL